jgi:biopolymer transport protein ExbD
VPVEPLEKAAADKLAAAHVRDRRMSARLSQQHRAEPNLTPILDMVFQLITFFMLVINFKSAEMDLSLKLPVVGSARPVETHGQRGLLVLNIDNAGNLKIYGRVVKNIEGYVANEAVAARMAARLDSADMDAENELPTTIVIRADRATPFRMLNRVIKACQDNGFRRFALKAVNKET